MNDLYGCLSCIGMESKIFVGLFLIIIFLLACIASELRCFRKETQTK